MQAQLSNVSEDDLTVGWTYTWTALPRLPLSNLDSNMSVVSSGALVGVAFDPGMLGPAREQMNYIDRK